MLLNPIRVDGKLFHWNGNKGSQEISSLNLRRFEQVWDDSCDEGITVVGKEREVVFVVASTDTTDEGEITGRHLVSINMKNGRTDGKFKLLIIND